MRVVLTEIQLILAYFDNHDAIGQLKLCMGSAMGRNVKIGKAQKQDRPMGPMLQLRECQVRSVIPISSPTDMNCAIPRTPSIHRLSLILVSIYLSLVYNSIWASNINLKRPLFHHDNAQRFRCLYCPLLQKPTSYTQE